MSFLVMRRPGGLFLNTRRCLPLQRLHTTRLHTAETTIGGVFEPGGGTGMAGDDWVMPSSSSMSSHLGPYSHCTPQRRTQGVAGIDTQAKGCACTLQDALISVLACARSPSEVPMYTNQRRTTYLVGDDDDASSPCPRCPLFPCS